MGRLPETEKRMRFSKQFDLAREKIDIATGLARSIGYSEVDEPYAPYNFLRHSMSTLLAVCHLCYLTAEDDLKDFKLSTADSRRSGDQSRYTRPGGWSTEKIKANIAAKQAADRLSHTLGERLKMMLADNEETKKRVPTGRNDVLPAFADTPDMEEVRDSVDADQEAMDEMLQRTKDLMSAKTGRNII